MGLLSSTKAKIIQAAVTILETKGISGLSQTSVAKSVGIPQGQLTYHFPKRADLILAVTEAALDSAADLLFRGKEEPFLNYLLETMKSKSRSRALMSLSLEADQNPEIRARILVQGQRVRTLIAAALGVSPEDPQVSTVHSLLIGYGIQFFLVEEKSARVKLEHDFLQAFRSLSPPPKKGKSK